MDSIKAFQVGLLYYICVQKLLASKLRGPTESCSILQIVFTI